MLPETPHDDRSSRPILATTDFSATADSGLAWAARIAEVVGAPLHLVHATLETGSLGDYLGLADETLDELERREGERLQAVAEALRADGIEAASSMARGNASEVITEVATRLEARLVVLGTHGRRGLAHLMLGSTAERVAQQAPCPVLSVHPGDTSPAWPPRKVLLATDFSAESAAALDAVVALCGDRPPTSIALLHACHVPYQLGSENPCASVTEGSELRRGIVEDVDRRLRDFGAAVRAQGIAIEIDACEGHADDRIVERATTLGTDLVAMGTRGRSGLAHVLLGSTAHRVIQRAPCPVLTARA
jgi:nucleotide-binding universal stress UspA family protein